MSFDPYPSTLNPEVFQIAAQAVVGNLPDRNHGIHALVEVVRYGAGVAFPDPAPASNPAQPPLAKTPHVQLTREQVAGHLTTLANHPHGTDRKAVAALNLPWGQIIMVLLQSLMDLSAGKTS